MDESTIAELNTEIESIEETVTIDTTSIAVTDTGKLSDTLTDAEKGALKEADETSASASTAVAHKTHQRGRRSRLPDFKILPGPWFPSHSGSTVRQHNSGCSSS